MAKKDRFSLLAAPLFLALAACSGTTASDLGSQNSATGGDGAGSAAGGSATAGGSKGTVSGGNYVIVLRAEQSPVAVDPSTAGQTPSDQRIGFLGLRLKKDAGDASPLDVADFSAPVDVGYNDGDETVVAKVPARSLAAGHYTVAEVPIAYVRFMIGGTYHDSGASVPGTFADVISMANGTVIDGSTHDEGWWKSSFSSTAGTTLGVLAGENAVFGQPGGASGIVLDTSQSPSKYVFSTSLDVDPTIDHDVKVVFTVNTFEDFRWQDASGPGYANGVFDVSGSSFETVTQLGANSIATTIE